MPRKIVISVCLQYLHEYTNLVMGKPREERAGHGGALRAFPLKENYRAAAEEEKTQFFSLFSRIVARS